MVVLSVQCSEKMDEDSRFIKKYPDSGSKD